MHYTPLLALATLGIPFTFFLNVSAHRGDIYARNAEPWDYDDGMDAFLSAREAAYKEDDLVFHRRAEGRARLLPRLLVYKCETGGRGVLSDAHGRLYSQACRHQFRTQMLCTSELTSIRTWF